jgi:hypothetical protein
MQGLSSEPLACEKPFKEANKELKKGNAATALQL